MDWKRIIAAMLLVCTLAIPARAEETPKGEANITPQTTMRELRANPSIIGSGIYTYSQEQENECRREKWADTTLEEFVNSYTADECAKGLNHLIENYNAGVQITHKIYTAEEIAAVPSRNKAELYYFPGNTKGGKYVLILGGNAVNTSAELREGVATAEEMNGLGYTAFVLRYRIGRDAENDAPLEDISHAVAYITAHAEELGVSPEDYAIVGYSSGGQIAGFFGSKELGWKKYGLPKPGALLLGYPVNSFSYIKPVWALRIDPFADGIRYFERDMDKYITADFPPTYHWEGKNDEELAKLWMPAQGRRIEKALAASGVPHKSVYFKNAPHKIGPGAGTDAEGWLADATAFWEEQVAAKNEAEQGTEAAA